MDLFAWAQTRSDQLATLLGPLPPVESWWDIASDARDLAFDLHAKQTRFGTKLPYAVHLIDTAMISFAAFHFSQPQSAVDLRILLISAWLHDSIEDQGADPLSILALGGPPALSSIQALSKDPSLSKEAATMDSLARIALAPLESSWVKLSDRTSNLFDPPPSRWNEAKIASYLSESHMVLQSLGHSSAYLAAALSGAISRYQSIALTPPPPAPSSPVHIRP